MGPNSPLRLWFLAIIDIDIQGEECMKSILDFGLSYWITISYLGTTFLFTINRLQMIELISGHTVDGKNPAPLGIFIP